MGGYVALILRTGGNVSSACTQLFCVAAHRLGLAGLLTQDRQSAAIAQSAVPSITPWAAGIEAERAP
jgi:hypothetical protein